jgi:hypothetical protein
MKSGATLNNWIVSLPSTHSIRQITIIVDVGPARIRAVRNAHLPFFSSTVLEMTVHVTDRLRFVSHSHHFLSTSKSLV